MEIKKAIRATLIHGVTFREVERCTLDQGTTYKRESQPDSSGTAAILVEGYRYLVNEADLEA